MEAVGPVIALDGDPYLLVTSVGREKHVRGGEGRKSGNVRNATTVAHGAMDSDKKSFRLVWQCHHLLSVFLAKGY